MRNGLRRLLRFFVGVLSLMYASLAHAQATFTPLGGLHPNPAFLSSVAAAISADGKVVVGDSVSSGDGTRNTEAFRWTAETRMVALGDLPGGSFHSSAFDVSADGSAVVGHSLSDNGAIEAFRWTAGGGMMGLGSIPGGDFASSAVGVSGDGSVAVGWSQTAPDFRHEAFRWTENGGMVGLGFLPGTNMSQAYDASSDGAIVVGFSRLLPSTRGMAFRWTEDTGMVDLGGLTATFEFSWAFAISDDGRVIVGESVSENRREAFRWTADEGMVGLGDLPGGPFSSAASGVNADGSIILGYSSTAETAIEPFYWTATTGMVKLRDFLIAHGLDLTGWTLHGATISADGVVLAGNGINPQGFSEAWVATIPEPGTWVVGLLGVIGVWFAKRRLC